VWRSHSVIAERRREAHSPASRRLSIWIRISVTCRGANLFPLENGGFATVDGKTIGRSRNYPLLFQLGGFAAYFLRGFSHKILASK
jgi:hypothetical protein